MHASPVPSQYISWRHNREILNRALKKMRCHLYQAKKKMERSIFATFPYCFSNWYHGRPPYLVQSDGHFGAAGSQQQRLELAVVLLLEGLAGLTDQDVRHRVRVVVLGHPLRRRPLLVVHIPGREETGGGGRLHWRYTQPPAAVACGLAAGGEEFL